MNFIGLSFDHMHMGDLLRLAKAHPQANVVALCDDNPANLAVMQEFAAGIGRAGRTRFHRLRARFGRG